MWCTSRVVWDGCGNWGSAISACVCELLRNGRGMGVGMEECRLVKGMWGFILIIPWTNCGVAWYGQS